LVGPAAAADALAVDAPANAGGMAEDDEHAVAAARIRDAAPRSPKVFVNVRMSWIPFGNKRFVNPT
jgi:hypothetical protein